MALNDPEWEEGQAPHEIGRAQFGRISIANSDSEAYAYVNAAIDAAWHPYEENKDFNQNVLCDILDFTKFKNNF